MGKRTELKKEFLLEVKNKHKKRAWILFGEKYTNLESLDDLNKTKIKDLHLSLIKNVEDNKLIIAEICLDLFGISFYKLNELSLHHRVLESSYIDFIIREDETLNDILYKLNKRINRNRKRLIKDAY